MRYTLTLFFLMAPLAYAEGYTNLVQAPTLDSLKTPPRREVYVPIERPLDPIEKDYIRESTKTQEIINERLRYDRLQKPLDDAISNLFNPGGAERIR